MLTQYLPRVRSFFLPEQALYQKGHYYVAGVDEVGRGPLAGPVVAAAVVLPPGCEIPGLTDSKKLTPDMREKLSLEIRKAAIGIGIGKVDHTEIDTLNILNASLKAMVEAVKDLPCPVDYVLVDGIFPIPIDIPQMILKKGDTYSMLIAAASVIAKVTRDHLMEEYHHHYPWYNFSHNKGYGTREHLEAIEKHGYCFLHRKTFKGVSPTDSGS